ncbi:MAG: hypothetical protein Q8M94_08670 [Ignavibacteria bacterium]|nr:hypothetical protein [Ignavibacteria bacterium]
MKKLTSNSKLKVMKKYFLYIIVLLAFIYSGCDKPGPTELVDDETFDVEILGKDIEDEFYSNGFDSSGVIENRINFASVISVGGIKLTKANTTINISAAQTIIFDKTKPFRSPHGVLLGYNTIIPGSIKFDDVQARLTNYRVRFREAGLLIDTVLGRKYELFHINGINSDEFIYPYNSSITFIYSPFFGGQQSSFEFLTPKEVTGNVKIVRANNQNDFRIELNWNGESVNNFSVIIGGVRTQNQQAFPFYRIKTKDDGNLIIPSSLLKNIPRDRFNKITISFIRKYDKLVQVQNNEVYVASQSIHTIIVDIP